MSGVSSGLDGAVQWYRARPGRVRALQAQQAALELQDPGGRLLLEQGRHVVGEDPQQGQAVLDLLGVDGAGGAAGARPPSRTGAAPGGAPGPGRRSRTASSPTA